MSDKQLDKYGYVIISSYRTKIVSMLNNRPLTPKQLSIQTKIHLSHVSNALMQLQNEEILYCVNPERNKGRIYRLTDLGEWIANRISTETTPTSKE